VKTYLPRKHEIFSGSFRAFACPVKPFFLDNRDHFACPVKPFFLFNRGAFVIDLSRFRGQFLAFSISHREIMACSELVI
jgi:hypothetical protein